MNSIIDEIKYTGERIFYKPNPELDYVTLAHKSLSSNTYRGFHKIDKDSFGAKEVFEETLIKYSGTIADSLNGAKDEKDIDLLSIELCRILKLELSKNIRNAQLLSFNKLRKPVDIVIEHMISMGSDFNSVRQKLTKYLFLPLDSQMFQSSIVFSDEEIQFLKIDRTFTFKDICSNSHYYNIQSFLSDKAARLNIDRIFFDLLWNERYKSNGGNLFETNPKNKDSQNLSKEYYQFKIKYLKHIYQLQKIKEKDIEQKLVELTKLLLDDFRFQNYIMSEPILFKGQDRTVWLSNFHDSIKLQIIHFKKEEIKINIRSIEDYPLNEAREKFVNQVSKVWCMEEIKDKDGCPYVPVKSIPKFIGTFDNIEEIKMTIIETINKISKL